MSKTVFTLIATGVFGCAILSAQAPAIATGGTVNAADYTRAFAPGAIVSIFGSNLSTATGGAVNVPLPTTLGGATVNVISGGTTTPASLFYVSPKQINAQLPTGISVGSAQIQVVTSAGTSTSDTITIAARAPKIFTQDFSGTGAAVVTDPQANLLTAKNPMKPAGSFVIYMNSLGATDQTVAAGDVSPGVAIGTSPANIKDTVTASVNGQDAKVAFVGLTPNSVGLYQVNLTAPFVVLTGPVNVIVTVGGVASQASVNAPYQQLGFYTTVLGGRAIAGQTLTGAQGTNSVLAFRQNDPVAWGAEGLNAWSKNTGITAAAISGEAFTLKNGATVLFDNNGIEDQSFASFYNNGGGGADSAKPGLTTTFSMSNYFPLVFATDIKFSGPTTITEMIGYFDCNGDANLPFDNQNPYIQYRMNIWSAASTGSVPKETGNFVGDAFTSTTVPGTFTISTTSVNRVSSSTASLPDAICRLDYKPTTPITLATGEYWFSHDASIRTTPAVGGTSTSQSITLTELRDIIQMQKSANTGKRTTVNFFGKPLFFEESWQMPIAVEVRPTAVSNQ
jgi:uncharacterized protein (TIGR03437 family)